MSFDFSNSIQKQNFRDYGLLAFNNKGTHILYPGVYDLKPILQNLIIHKNYVNYKLFLSNYSLI